jgi:hypothetical protein
MKKSNGLLQTAQAETNLEPRVPWVQNVRERSFAHDPDHFVCAGGVSKSHRRLVGGLQPSFREPQLGTKTLPEDQTSSGDLPCSQEAWFRLKARFVWVQTFVEASSVRLIIAR